MLWWISSWNCQYVSDQWCNNCLTLCGQDYLKLLVIRQNGESQIGCLKKTKHFTFSKKWIFLTPLYTRTCAYQGVKNVLFFGKFGVLCFLETPILRFALLPYCQQNVIGKYRNIGPTSRSSWSLSFSDFIKYIY